MFFHKKQYNYDCLPMNVIDFYYNEDNNRLYLEFSMKEDSDMFYRVLELDFEDVKYYSPSLITRKDMTEIDEEFIIELLSQYLIDNELPEQQSL